MDRTMWYQRVAVLPLVEATTSEGRRIRARVELDVVFGRVAARLSVLDTEPPPPLERVDCLIVVGEGASSVRVPVRWELDFSGSDRAADFVITDAIAPALDREGRLKAQAAFAKRGRGRRGKPRRRRPA